MFEQVGKSDYANIVGVVSFRTAHKLNVAIRIVNEQKHGEAIDDVTTDERGFVVLIRISGEIDHA